MTDVTRTDGEPHNRLTLLCAAVGHALRTHPDYEGEAFIVMLDGAEEGGMYAHGYDDDSDAIAHMLAHAQAYLGTCGIDLQVIPLTGPGGQG